MLEQGYAYASKGWVGWVYGISTLVGYLMTSPVCTYILCKQIL